MSLRPGQYIFNNAIPHQWGLNEVTGCWTKVAVVFLGSWSTSILNFYLLACSPHFSKMNSVKQLKFEWPKLKLYCVLPCSCLIQCLPQDGAVLSCIECTKSTICLSQLGVMFDYQQSLIFVFWRIGNVMIVNKIRIARCLELVQTHHGRTASFMTSFCTAFSKWLSQMG